MGRKKDGEPLDKAAAQAFLESMLPSGGLKADGEGTMKQFPDIGLRLNSMAERLLFWSNVILFGKFVTVYGAEGSRKSTFVFDRYRAFREAGGAYLHIDAEDKDALAMRKAILGYPANHVYEDWTRRADTLQGWQESYYAYVGWFQDVSEKAVRGKEKLGRRAPLAIGIDSVTGKVAEETIKAFHREHGTTKSRFAAEAKHLSDWSKIAPTLLTGWPIVTFLVSHNKPKTDDMGRTLNNTPGGMGPKYQTAVRFLLEDQSKFSAGVDGPHGRIIQITSDKNTYGASNIRLGVPVLYGSELDPETGEKRLKAWWDWDWATTNVLHLTTETADKGKGWGGGERMKAMKELTGLKRHPGDVYSCKALGVSEDDALPPSEMGKLINADRALSDQLDTLYGISKYTEFVPGEDIRDTVGWDY